MRAGPALEFVLSDERVATAPPEARGLRRDQVRLLVARPDRLVHTGFRHLGDHLSPGDVLVVNTSATRPAAVPATWRRRPVLVHLSTELEDGHWVLELRTADRRPLLDASPGDRVRLAGGGRVVLDAPLTGDDLVRLWRASLLVPDRVDRFLEAQGRPITYGYLDRDWPLDYYQTVFARVDDRSGASAEMPSAARPFTASLVTELVANGISILPVTLHAGLSSLERDEPPHAERYRVSAATAAMINLTRRRNHRVVAVGTTVTRALETVADEDGTVHPGAGWTELVLGPTRPARLVNGLVTGWHPPEASHLLLLEAVAGSELVEAGYRAALGSDYLWHEFGDSCLFLP